MEARQIRSLVDRELAVVFYDLTIVRLHGEGEVEDDIRAFAQVHPGNVAETKTLQAMLHTVLHRFPIQRVIMVADRGLLSLENIGELTAIADQGGRKLEFVLVPARRYRDLLDTFRGLAYDDPHDGPAGAEPEGITPPPPPLRRPGAATSRRSGRRAPAVRRGGHARR